MDPNHEDAKRSLIFKFLRNREHDHAVDLIEASIQKGEDPDLLLRALVSSSTQALGPITDRLIRTQILGPCAFID